MGLHGNVRRSLREIFGCILLRCGRCLWVVGCFEKCPTWPEGKRGRARSTNLCSECPTSWGLFLFMFGAHLRAEVPGAPFYPGAQWLSRRKRGLRDGQGFVYCQDDQSVTAGDRCIITILLPFFSPPTPSFSPRGFVHRSGKRTTSEIKPGLLSSVPLSFCGVRGHKVGPVLWWTRSTDDCLVVVVFLLTN